MGTVFLERERRDLVHRCRTILAAARSMNRGAAALADVAAPLASLSDRYGGPGVAFALRAWCDTLIEETPGAHRGQPVQVAFLDPAGGAGESRHPAERWAGELVAARFADDQMRFYELTAQLPTDDAGARGAYVFCLVELVAEAIDSYTDPPGRAAGGVRPGLYLPDFLPLNLP